VWLSVWRNVQSADLHMAQLMPLPLTVSCFSKIQIGFTFLLPAHPGSPGQRAVKRVCMFLRMLPAAVAIASSGVIAMRHVYTSGFVCDVIYFQRRGQCTQSVS